MGPDPSRRPGRLRQAVHHQCERHRQVTGYALPSDVTWRNAYGVWQDGTRPACLAPLSSGQRITLGVISAAPVGDAPGGSVVVWIECPSRPIPRYPIVSPSSAPG